MSTYKQFRQLHIGARFEFASVEQFPHSGMERGPWRKTSARMYRKDTTPFTGDPISQMEHATLSPMVCTVGTVTVEVIEL